MAITSLEAAYLRGLGELPKPLLDPQAIYLSPSGRTCRVRGISNGETWAVMIYDTPKGEPATRFHADGFTLSASNWRLLRRIA